MVTRSSTYEKRPWVPVTENRQEVAAGWIEITSRLRSAIPAGRFVLCVECYPGSPVEEITSAIETCLRPGLTIASERCFQPPETLERQLASWLTDDPVFGRMQPIELDSFVDRQKVAECRSLIDREPGLTVVIGTGASLVCGQWGMLVYACMARWEIQQRQRRNQIGNLGMQNQCEPAATKYKRAFFVDWRAADALKRRLYERIDFLLDANDPRTPKMVNGGAFRRGLELAVQRPFRVVPYFDPGPWGGEWMRETFSLPYDAPNYAWCFDCVPEENSLLLGFGSERIEVPAIDLVFRHPVELLGGAVHARFGAEFPIRFDMLDTMGGGNLSLQVHPLGQYIRKHFGMTYTQDESYYLLDAGPDAVVYLGLKEGVDRPGMAADLKRAQETAFRFPDEAYVNQWPARKHDHFLIPAGTVHCSGRNCMVLEISATPYIFTFKLWDWERLGLNGEPRPIHLAHGMKNIQWSRTTEWVRRELINRVSPVASAPGWTEERTGLHQSEFIETRRHWFTAPVPHHTGGSVNVLNLVEGEQALVESPSGAFAPFAVNYAETFIVPACVGDYTIRPLNGSGSRHATIKASVRI